MFNILLRRNVTRVTDDFFLIYHPPGTFPRLGFTRQVYYNDIKRLFSLTFQEFENTLLKKPYATDCRDYNMTGYENKGACWEACVQEESLNRFGKIAPGTNVFKGDVTMSLSGIN